MIIVVISSPTTDPKNGYVDMDLPPFQEDYYGPFATDKVAEDWAEKMISKIPGSTALVTTLTEPS